MSTEQIWTNIVAYVLQIGLLVGIGATLPALLRLGGGGRAPSARLVYWQALLVACLALPWMRPWHSETIAVASTPFAVLPVAAFVPETMAVSPAMPSLAVIALWLLVAGITARLVWMAFGLLKLSRHRRNGRAIPLPPEWSGMAAHATLLISDEVSGPVTFGFFQPVVLLPAAFPSMPESMRNAILFHELLHVERSDWLFTLGEEIVRAVFWFHPALWWVLGEIQLAREQTVDQAVIDMTQARDPYVDTLLAMAGVNPQMDLAPAPLFLRRRHLKKRVIGLVQEARMSKTRIILAQAAALTTLAAACWVVTGAFPLQGQAQMVADSAGVTVNLNGSQLLHRSPVTYPAEALANGVEGTVVVQVRLDAKGEVIDSAILSGPDELRRGLQSSVQNWHFDKREGSSTRVVNIDFVKPSSPVVVAPPSLAVGSRTAVPGSAVALPGGRGSSGSFRLAPGSAQFQARTPMSGPIDQIDVEGLSDTAKAQLLAELPVHVGDSFSPDTINRARDAARQFDEHLVVSASRTSGGALALRIAWPPGVVVAGQGVVPLGPQLIGGNVMDAKLISAVKPAYPPLAKLARQQGTVRFQATIGKDGKVENLNLISGPPLLVQSATDAANQWLYQPTVQNGSPVEVSTTININFSLSGDGSAMPQ